VDTAIDQIISGKNANVSAQQFYDAFDATRDTMRKHYGETVKLFRATGAQKTKATTNWATTEAFAKKFGGNIISKEIPIDEVIAVNVGVNGKYHEIIVGKKPKGIEEITNPAGRIPAQFPYEYAKYLKQHFPEIWKLGGNIRGNDAFRWWSAYRQGDRSPTVTHWWTVTRPAWIARHYRDHRIAGVIAQIKWGTIGTLGVAGMKRVIETKIRNSR